MQIVASSGNVASQALSLLSMFEDALQPRDQTWWSHWLHGEVHGLLPHDAMLAAWGDLRGGSMSFEVFSRDDHQLRRIGRSATERLVTGLFDTWLASGQQPIVADNSQLRTASEALAGSAECALVHGLEDHRGHYDCVYVLLGPQELGTSVSRQLCRVLLPFIDSGFRQLPHRIDPAPARARYDDSEGERGALSAREHEIMQWVRMGKTNSEIAMILGLSTFTVKNHMRRIYRKLDVLNRAQAVANLDRLQGVPQQAGR